MTVHGDISKPINKSLECMTVTHQIFVKSMTYLYMKVRLMHALKVSNVVTQRNVAGVKRNRKLLKLNHS